MLWAERGRHDFLCTKLGTNWEMEKNIDFFVYVIVCIRFSIKVLDGQIWMKTNRNVPLRAQ